MELLVLKSSMKLYLDRNKCWQGCRERGMLSHCCWECKLVQPLWRTVWSSSKKLKMELPLDPAIPLLSFYPKKTKITNSKRYPHPHVHHSIIYNTQDIETT